MSKVIVGIHGLANKPEKNKLKEWWLCSINEGLQKNCDYIPPDFSFKLVYWADLLYRNPVHNDPNFDFDDLYNNQPYLPAEDGTLVRREDGFLDDVVAKVGGLFGKGIDLAKEHLEMDGLADWVLGKVAKDLAFYYDENRKIADRSEAGELAEARKVLMGELKKVLLSLQGEDIMLIAHSMGAIIAYDVLRDIGQDNPDFELNHFVTIGAPLGLAHVKKKIIDERVYSGEENKRVRTPTIVKKTWVNYADRKDPIALDVHLKDDYRANNSGIRVEDDLVSNTYVNAAGAANYHKSYGYLRTPELSDQIKAFLSTP